MTIDDLDAVTRIEMKALLSFLQDGVAYQSRVARMMRTVSESLHLVQYHQPVDEPKYKNSTQLKLINLFVSRQAALLMGSTQGEFVAGTVLEHPLPLEKMYLNLKPLATRNYQSIVDVLGGWPLITVTRQEDRELKHSGWDNPADRYRNANIEVGRVEAIRFGSDAPKWKPIAHKGWLTDPRPGGPIGRA